MCERHVLCRSPTVPGPPRQHPARPATCSHHLQPSAPHLFHQAPQRPREADGCHLPGEAGRAAPEAAVRPGAREQPLPLSEFWSFHLFGGGIGTSEVWLEAGVISVCDGAGSRAGWSLPLALRPLGGHSWGSQERGLCNQTVWPWASDAASLCVSPVCEMGDQMNELDTQQPTYAAPRSVVSAPSRTPVPPPPPCSTGWGEALAQPPTAGPTSFKLHWVTMATSQVRGPRPSRGSCLSTVVQ